MTHPLLNSNNGHSSLTVLVVILLISTLFLAASPLLRRLSQESLEFRQELNHEIRARQIAKEVITALEDDPTPESHSRVDPVWELIEQYNADPDLEVTLRDVSSHLNPNWMRTKLFEETVLKNLIQNGISPNEIKDIRSQEGFVTSLEPWEETFGRENLDRFFTLYGWANINVTYEESLEELYRIRAGESGAAAFRSRIQDGLRDGKLWNQDELRTVLGPEAEKLYPVINSLPQFNVHFIDPLLLEALLSYPYREEPLSGYMVKKKTILDTRERAELTDSRLKSIINASEEQQRVFEYLGTRTWFWELNVTDGDNVYIIIISCDGTDWQILEGRNG